MCTELFYFKNEDFQMWYLTFDINQYTYVIAEVKIYNSHNRLQEYCKEFPNNVSISMQAIYAVIN